MHSLLLPLRDGLSIAQLRRDPSSVGPLGGGSLGGGSLGGGSLGGGSGRSSGAEMMPIPQAEIVGGTGEP